MVNREKEIETGDRLVCPECGFDNYDYEATINSITGDINIPESGRVHCNDCDEDLEWENLEPVGIFEAHGYLTICNTGGVEMQLNDSCDAARLKFTNDDLPTQWLEIHHGPDGNSYVNYNDIAYYLEEFMRVDF